MTWTRRKTTELIRLLKEYKRECPKRESKLLDPEQIDQIIAFIKLMEGDYRDLGGPGPGNRDSSKMLGHLRWWCDLVKDHYGMKQYTAITWLMKQYYDKEGKQTFSRKWGASVVSVAHRLDQKVKYHKAVAPQRITKEQCEATLKGDAEIYELTFKLLKLWPEPGSFRK